MQPNQTTRTLQFASLTLATALTAACVDQPNHTLEKTTSAYPKDKDAEQEHTPKHPRLESTETSAAANKVAADIAVKGKPRMQRSIAFHEVALTDSLASAPAYRMHIQQPQITDRENYLHYEDNGVKQVRQEPVSTFSIDVDTAAYANVRRMISQEGRLPPADAVRLEELINYFSYSYAPPSSQDQPFSIHTELAPAPWSAQHKILQIGLKGFEPQVDERPAANLVFLVDVSGSMQAQNKLALVKKSLRLLVNRMNASDRIALAVYAGAAGTVLESTPGDQKAKILAAIDGLQAGGSTHGSAGIKLAYQLAEQHRIEGGINRVLIASDGDMNVGTVSIDALKSLITKKREKGIALTTLGYGSGNYNYALMEQLADVGDGNAAYIDSMKEAQKVLVNEMQSTLHTIASDVKIQVEFNPELVSEYRLIGYENRMLNREDFNNDKVDAGDIGAGHTVTALYEVVLTGSGGERIDPLRYGKKANATALDDKVHSRAEELAFVKLRYKTPGEKKSKLVTQAIHADSMLASIERGTDNLRFAASVAGFGQILKGGNFTGSWGYADALTLARSSRGDDAHGYRSEFLHLIELAQSLSSGS
ncbi:MAG: von Willebrand factor type A domain-containing protein [Halioglobus sp.]